MCDGLSLWCSTCWSVYQKQRLASQTEEQRLARQQYRRAYYVAHQEEILIKQHQYNLEHPDEQKARNKKHNKENRDSINKWRRKYIRSNPLFRIANNLRSRLGKVLARSGFAKKFKFDEYIGCTSEELKAHIEKQFTEGMNWDNYGVHLPDSPTWQIDHIVPLASAKTEDDIYKLCHYTNLQPLWAKDNAKKGHKML